MPHTTDRFAKREVRRQHARVPHRDWAVLTQGLKTEFREAGRYAANPVTLREGPFIAYAQNLGHPPRYTLLWLEEAWREPLGSISPESLEREGFESLREFRRYWRERHRTPFKPLSLVTVIRCRPMRDGDLERAGQLWVDYLYGELL